MDCLRFSAHMLAALTVPPLIFFAAPLYLAVGAVRHNIMGLYFALGAVGIAMGLVLVCILLGEDESLYTTTDI